MRPGVRDRLVLPILLPVGILALIAAVLVGFSRILLSLPKTAATTTALIVSGAIVVISAIASSRAEIRFATIASMAGATAGVAMLVGGLALAVVTGEAEEPAGGAGPAPGGITVVAQNIAFDTSTIELPADTATTITLDNRDAGVQHNIAIYTDDTLTEELFSGELITGPATATYEIPALAAGEYYFLCVVHPNMNGTAVVGGGGGEPAPTGTETGTAGPPADGGGGAGGGATASPAGVVAQNIAFDTSTIELPADTATTITLDNRDAGVQHNIAIYTDDTLTEELFSGELITGPATATYEIPALAAGEYYFLCVVHPNMNGTVIVG